MNKYLLDTNHLSGYLDRKPSLEDRSTRRYEPAIGSAFAFPSFVNTVPAFDSGNATARISSA